MPRWGRLRYFLSLSACAFMLLKSLSSVSWFCALRSTSQSRFSMSNSSSPFDISVLLPRNQRRHGAARIMLQPRTPDVAAEKREGDHVSGPAHPGMASEEAGLIGRSPGRADTEPDGRAQNGQRQGDDLEIGDLGADSGEPQVKFAPALLQLRRLHLPLDILDLQDTRLTSWAD